MQKNSYSTINLIKNLLAFVWPYKTKFAVATFLRIAGELAWLYPAYAFAAITTFFTTYHKGDPLTGFWTIMILFSASCIVYFGCSFFGFYWGFIICEKTGINSQQRVLKHLFSLDMEWHEKENTGNKIRRVDRGGEGINQLLRMWLGAFIEIGISLVGVIFIISRFDFRIALSTIVFMIFYFLISNYYTINSAGTKRKENLKDEEYGGLVYESLNNIRSAKVMSMVKPLSEKVSNLAGELFFLIKKRIFWFQSGGAVKNLSAQVFRIAVMCYIAIGIMEGKYEIGFMVLFWAYFSVVSNAVSKLADTSQDFAIRKQDVGRMIDILEVEPITDVEEGKVPMPKNWKEIVFKDVSFAYGDKKVLENVNFTISRGEKIGVMGLSGAGKSTIFKLLLKERENYEGEILIDNVPLKSISKSDYFRHTAVVMQDTEVFNFPLRSNVTISNYERENDEKLLDKALSVAHVLEFAEKLPQGIDTLIGEKGVKLSGGEKQRVGVARAIFKDPELLLLDEATSHLDVESEEKIQDSLHKFFKSVTAIVIAHRLTTIKEMDKILVIEGGKVIEQGTFTKLHRAKGRFHELWEKQRL